MFKIQDNNLNNSSERYIFHPRTRLSKTLHGSFTGYTSSRDNTKRIMFGNNYNENSKISFKEDMFYKLKNVPPVYFYRKINSPYKYDIVSVPEYLVKTDEERHFIDKLNQLIINETDRKALNNLIINKKKEKKFKDRYKPSVLDVQNILRYKPNLYSNSFLFEKRSNSVMNLLNKDNNILAHDSKNNTIDIEKIFDDNKEKEEKEEKNEKIMDNNEQNEEKKEEKEKEKKKEDKISEEDQIKYKYKISDIYNNRNEKVITDKSAEKYLFKNLEKINNNLTDSKNENKNNENNFYNTSKSKSDWIPNRTIGTKMNSFSSVSYNILSPLYKGYNKFVSPSELNKNNLYNESTAFHRTKSISEFIDLTRVSASNTLNCFSRKNKIPNFKLRNSVATNQADEYHINRDLIEKPI